MFTWCFIMKQIFYILSQSYQVMEIRLTYVWQDVLCKTSYSTFLTTIVVQILTWIIYWRGLSSSKFLLSTFPFGWTWKWSRDRKQYTLRLEQAGEAKEAHLYFIIVCCSLLLPNLLSCVPWTHHKIVPMLLHAAIKNRHISLRYICIRKLT